LGDDEKLPFGLIRPNAEMEECKIQSAKCKMIREGKQKKTGRGKRWNIIFGRVEKWNDGIAKASP
jgi:hypothetical protein